MMPAIVDRVHIHRLHIPLRRRVSHAATSRDTSEPIIVSVELRNGTVGYGETLPRKYVTGEDTETAVATIGRVFVPVLAEFHADRFPDALAAIEALPWTDEHGVPVPAARAAVEMALLDATLRCFDRQMDDVVAWMGLPGFGSPGALSSIRFSGVLAGNDTARTLKRLRWMYWYGLRHFKLKVGTTGDRERLVGVARYLDRAIRRGKASLRVDANGAWSKDEAIEWLGDSADLAIACVEQPLAKGSEADLPILHDLFSFRLMHDESLVTMNDAERLIALGVAGGFNIRLSKCGGMLPSLRIAARARRSEIPIMMGCMVGETSILSSAGLHFLQVCPGVDWAEGCFGSLLLTADVTRRGLRFGIGGRPPRIPKGGISGDVDEARLARLGDTDPVVVKL